MEDSIRVPSLRMRQEPVLTDAEAWSEWFFVCHEILQAPDFYVARAYRRRKMMEAYKAGDKQKQGELLQEFRSLNEKFHQKVRNTLFGTPEIMSKLQGTVIYLCAGIEFTEEIGLISKQLAVVDHAKRVVEHLRRELKKDSQTFGRVKVVECSVHKIGEHPEMPQAGTVDAVVAIRGLHRVPPLLRVQTLKAANGLLAPEGILVNIELYEEDRPPHRELTPGEWFWTIPEYEQASGMTRTGDFPIIENQDDNCRLALFR